jgi:uncharacterized membrane protein YidH (DUF202 family)
MLVVAVILERWQQRRHPEKHADRARLKVDKVALVVCLSIVLVVIVLVIVLRLIS